jgi:hypothetical protein
MSDDDSKSIELNLKKADLRIKKLDVFAKYSYGLAHACRDSGAWLGLPKKVNRSAWSDEQIHFKKTLAQHTRAGWLRLLARLVQSP